jgi:hypothetical protein
MPSPGRIILFVDYLEAWRGFDAFSADAADLNRETGHAIRILATCRASYRDRLPTSGIHIQDIGGKGAGEVAYAQAVTTHILSTLGVSIAPVAEACRNSPALAAFLAWLHARAPRHFQAEVLALAEEQDFARWAIARLRRAGTSDLAPVAALLAASPLPAVRFDAIASSHGGSPNDLRKILPEDGWLEWQDASADMGTYPEWTTFHDVFADVILAQQLSAAPTRADSIDRLLEVAAEQGVLAQTLVSLERLRGHACLDDVDWKSRLLELERRRPGTLATHAEPVLRNALPDGASKIALLVGLPTFREAVAAARSCDLSLALAYKDAVQTGAATHRGSIEVVLPMLDEAVARSGASRRVLRIAFEALPDRYRDPARLAALHGPPTPQTHFLLRALLEDACERAASEPDLASAVVESLKARVMAWLDALGHTWHASFVVVAWLNAISAVKGPDRQTRFEEVVPHVTAWLRRNDHAMRPEAQFVLKAWLDAIAELKDREAGGRLSKAQSYAEAWLSDPDHATRPEAQFVLTAWLDAISVLKVPDAKARIAALEPYAMAWLDNAENARRPEAGFILTAWLAAVTVVREPVAETWIAAAEGHVTAWLGASENAEGMEAQFVLTAWLKAVSALAKPSGEALIARAQEHTTTWLSHGDNGRRTEAQHVLAAWLNAVAAVKGPQAEARMNAVEPHVMAWLCAAGAALRSTAHFILAAWLDALSKLRIPRSEARIAKVEPHVWAWLGHADNATLPDAGFLYRAWLDCAEAFHAGDDGPTLPATFHEGFKAWLARHGDSEDISFLLEAWLAANQSFAVVQDTCFLAIRKFWDRPDTSYTLKYVVRIRSLPDHVVLAAADWCNRFVGHEDVLIRFSQLLYAGHGKVIGEARTTAVASRILIAQDIFAATANEYTRAHARALLVELVLLAGTFPLAEKLARVYFARWLRQPLGFVPDRDNAVKSKIDQRPELIELLLSLLQHRELNVANGEEDRQHVERFCDWVATWERRQHVPALAGELTDRFGHPDVWSRMMA